jgi:hypothetical protein
VDADEKELLEQILKWTRAGALTSVLARVGPMIEGDTRLRVYHAIAEGSRSPRAIEDVASVSRATAEKLVEEWRAAGLVVPDSDPPKATFTLLELGIPVPQLKSGRARGTTKK